MKTRVAIVVSHPIQHFTPLYRELARQQSLELKVFFCSRMGVDAYQDRDFGVAFKWEVDLLAGYPSEFLPGAGEVKEFGFWKVQSRDLWRYLDEFQPDVVQIYGYAQLLAWQALCWCQLRRVGTLLMSDSELVHERPPHVRAAKWLLLPRLYALVDGFLTIGDNNEAYLRHYGVERARMFRSPYPTNDVLFLKALEDAENVRARTRERLNIASDAFVALFVGKLIERKRPADLVSAVRLARQKSGRPVVALIVGDGALRGSVEAMLGPDHADEVRFAGFVNQGELPSMYVASDVVAHPADMDPHPIAVTEGVLMGLPAVVSNGVGSVGPTDTVRVGKNGFVFPVGDIEAFASALAKLAGDPLLYREMAQASRAIGAEMNIDASVRGYLEAVRAASRRPAVSGPSPAIL